LNGFLVKAAEILLSLTIVSNAKNSLFRSIKLLSKEQQLLFLSGLSQNLGDKIVTKVQKLSTTGVKWSK
jgi:hypothetical protein